MKNSGREKSEAIFSRTIPVRRTFVLWWPISRVFPKSVAPPLGIISERGRAVALIFRLCFLLCFLLCFRLYCLPRVRYALFRYGLCGLCELLREGRRVLVVGVCGQLPFFFHALIFLGKAVLLFCLLSFFCLSLSLSAFLFFPFPFLC